MSASERWSSQKSENANSLFLMYYDYERFGEEVRKHENGERRDDRV
jgi:hypothetical protein